MLMRVRDVYNRASFIDHDDYREDRLIPLRNRRGARVLSADDWRELVHRLALGPAVAVDGKSKGAGER